MKLIHCLWILNPVTYEMLFKNRLHRDFKLLSQRGACSYDACGSSQIQVEKQALPYWRGSIGKLLTYKYGAGLHLTKVLRKVSSPELNSMYTTFEVCHMDGSRVPSTTCQVSRGSQALVLEKKTLCKNKLYCSLAGDGTLCSFAVRSQYLRHPVSEKQSITITSFELQDLLLRD